MTPPTEGAPSAPERVWIERDGGDLDCCWTEAPTTADRVEYIRFDAALDAALDAIAGMLEAEGHEITQTAFTDDRHDEGSALEFAARYLRQRREP